MSYSFMLQIEDLVWEESLVLKRTVGSEESWQTLLSSREWFESHHDDFHQHVLHYVGSRLPARITIKVDFWNVPR